jgi:hypothetical protein
MTREERDAINHPPKPKCGRRADGTNPRALRTNPRAQGTNPNAQGTNPRARRKKYMKEHSLADMLDPNKPIPTR